MSVKIFKYLLSIFLILSILIIGSQVAHADCYISADSCNNYITPACTPSDILAEKCFNYTDAQVDQAGGVCDSTSEASAGLCQLGCCCLSTTSYNIWLQGFCNGRGSTIFNSDITSNNNNNCTKYCAQSSNKYNISGYIKDSNGFVNGADVSLSNTIFAFTDINGKYIFNDISGTSSSMTATYQQCKKIQTITLFNNEVINLTLDCPIVNVSGRILNADGTILPSANIDVLINSQHKYITSDNSGKYLFNTSSSTPVIITASNTQGCSGSVSLTTNDTNSNNVDITILCGATVTGTITSNVIPVDGVTISAIPTGKTATSGPIGAYTIFGLPIGSINISATKIIPQGAGLVSSETVCSNYRNIDVANTQPISGINIPLDANFCCNTTTTKTACNANNQYDISITYTGTCPGKTSNTQYGLPCPGTPLPACRQTCSDTDWSSCDNGATQSTCLNPVPNYNDLCNPNLPVIQLPAKPCVATCGNGHLESSTEDCDWVYGSSFNITTACDSMWSQNLTSRGIPTQQGDVLTNDLNDQLKTIMCNPGTCKCNPLPVIPPIPPTCNTPLTSISGPFVTVLKASPNVNIGWTINSCNNYVDHFELRSCTTSLTGDCTFAPLDLSGNSLNINPQIITYPYTINPYQENTKYCFKLTTVFNNSVPIANRILNSTACINTTVANCLYGNQNSWCIGNNLWSCNLTTNIASSVACDKSSTCTFVNGAAKCIPQAVCDYCNGLFGIFGYQGYSDIIYGGKIILCPSLTNPAPISNDNDLIGGCYRDYTKTVVDKAYNCNNTISCYDYYSENACTNDYCNKFEENGTNQCEWASELPLGFSDPFHTIKNIFNKGVCSPKVESQQQCELCNETGSAGTDGHNRLDYKSCSQNVCSLFGNCYFEPTYNKCINKGNLSCNDYINSDECIGINGNVSTDVAWNFTSKQIYQGTNFRINSSDGGVPRGIVGVCKWNPDIRAYMGSAFGCFRDADNYINKSVLFARDCKMPSGIANYSTLLYTCEHDTIPPSSKILNKSIYGSLMNLTDEIIISDNNQWGLGDDSQYCTSIDNGCPYILLKYCIIEQTLGNPPAVCYPNNVLSTTINAYTINLSEFNNALNNPIGIADSGSNFTLYYYAEDPAKNLEYPIHDFTFEADTAPPVVNVNLDMDSYQNGDVNWLTNLNVNITLLSVEKQSVTCSFKVTPTDDAVLAFEVNSESQYDIPTLSNPSNDKLLALGSKLSTTYPSLIDGIYLYDIDCYDALGNHFTNETKFTIEGNGLIYDPQPKHQIFTSNNAAIGANGVVQISINTSAYGNCGFTAATTASSALSTSFVPFDSLDGKYHTATVSIPIDSTQGNPVKYETGIYKYQVLCNLLINGKYYSVPGGSIDNPMFSIDDLAPVTTVQIEDHDIGSNSFTNYNDAEKYTSHADIRLNCNDSVPSLQLQNDNMYFDCKNANATYYCIEQPSNGIDCSNLNDYVPFSQDLKFNYGDGVPNIYGVTDKSMYGNSPTIHYYSIDNGGNNNSANPDVTTLRIKNMQLDTPDVSLWLESTQQNIPLVSSTPIINVSHITINVSYNTETDVNITNWTLRYYPNGVSDNTNYIDTYPQIIGGISYGKNEYDFDIPYADNGQYILMIRGVDDDGNTKDYNTAIITVKHPDNVITLISPIVGIGSTKEYTITVGTTFDSTCKYSMYDLASKGPNIALMYADDAYNLINDNTQGNTVHSFIHDGTSGTMYVICITTGTILGNDNNNAYNITSFNVGYNTSNPIVNISFIQNPYTNPLDNRIINSSYNATILNITTDQPSVCQIISSTPLQPTSVRIDPAKVFPGENYSVYDEYNLTHTYMINYSGTSASAGTTYNYNIKCTSLAQWNSSADTSIIFLPYNAPPIMNIAIQNETFNWMALNVTCDGICTNIYYYTMAKDNESCTQLLDSRFTDPSTGYENSYSDLIQVYNTSTICVRGFDVLGRKGTTNISVVLSFDNGVMNILSPYGYRTSPADAYDKIIYSPSRTFDLNISTEIGEECRYALSDTLIPDTDYSVVYNQMTNKFTTVQGATPLELNMHNASITINSEAQMMEPLVVMCYESNSLINSGNDAYVRRELYMYWDDSYPQISMNITPSRINDWNKRISVQFNINTSNEYSICTLNLSASKIINNVGGSEEPLNYVTDSISLDTGARDIFTSYTTFRNYTYNLPSRWLSDLNLNATYEFNVNCVNRAQLMSNDTESVLYDLDKAIIINVSSASVINGTSIPVKFTTNINSTCLVSINDTTPTITLPTTTIDGIHHTANFTGSSTQPITGTHNIIINCRVPNNANIAQGFSTYTITLDATPPVVNLSTIDNSDYVCGLNGFDINVNMVDDTGIAGYVYTITGAGLNTNASYGMIQNGILDNQISSSAGLITRTGVIHYPGTLIENQKYMISVQATDLAGKVSTPWSIISVTARTSTGSFDCDHYPPIGIITLAPTKFLDRIEATVTCSDDLDNNPSCNPNYQYSFTTNSNCSGLLYDKQGVLGTELTFNSSGLLCVKVSDLVGRNTWIQQYINISIDMSNPLNIRPAANMNYIAPNVIVTKVPITDINILTDASAECRYGRILIGDGTSSLEDLFDQYIPFTTSFSTTHTIAQFDTNNQYEQDIDIICNSTNLASSTYSRKVLKIIYTNDVPTLAASIDPELVFDWNDRQSTLSIETVPDTTCIITSNDIINTPGKIYLGNHNDADTYMPQYINTFTYSPNTPSGIYKYNINCSTMSNNYAQANVQVTYGISSVLNMTLERTTYNTKDIELLLNTTLISNCNLMWNNNYKGFLIKDISGRQHSIDLNNLSDGVYTAEFTCITPITRINLTQDYTITIDTTTPPNLPPQASITLYNTTFLDIMEANVACTDADDGCDPTYYYILTNNMNANCSKLSYSSANIGTLGGSPIQIFNDALLCVQVQDISSQKGYAQAYVNIPIDMNNPFNITPIQTNYIQPDVYIAYKNPTNVTVTTNINAKCKYSLKAPSGYITLTNQQLYDAYLSFDLTNLTTHTIYSILLSGYEQYLDIICYSTELASTNYSRKTLRIIYNTANPSIQAYADPALVDDWNARYSYLNIGTTPETVCNITSNDPNNKQYQLGTATDATTYDIKHAKKLLYTNLSVIDIMSYYYNISCRTLNGNASNAIVNIKYNITSNLAISLMSAQIFSTSNITIQAGTNLISDCKVKLNNLNQTGMINSVSQKIHSINISGISDGTYTTDITCVTPYTNFNNTLTFNITVNSSLAIPRCGDGIINTADEECDGNSSSELNKQTCNSLFNGDKYVGGELACGSDCKYDYSKCDNGHGYCGDDEVEGPNTLGMHEQCDGSIPSGLNCGSLGFQGGKLTCDNDCMLNTSRCVDTSTTGTTSAPICNGLLLQSGEQCEDSFFNASSIMCEDFGYDTGIISCNMCTLDLDNCNMDTAHSHSYYCGNDYREGSEQCDGISGMGGITCISLNFTGGIVSCGADCQFNTTKCINNAVNTGNSCTDGIKDGSEKDIDCGGNCNSCGLNKNCTSNTDCASGTCSNGKCALNSCSNNVFDSITETDVDCGNTCNACELNKNCNANSDCQSNYCINNICSTDPCSNGIIDSGESDIDCGGNCATCAIGKACISDIDCDSGKCYNNKCIESGTEPNPIKIPLMIIGALMTLAGGGYIIYKTFVAKPKNSGGSYGSSSGYKGQFTDRSGAGMTDAMPPNMPIILTPEQKELVRKQREALIKKRQVRLEERKGVIQQLGESSKEDKAKDNSKSESEKSSDKENKEESNDEFVDLSKIKISKDDSNSGKKESKENNSKDTFDKLRALNIDKTSKKIAQISGTPQENITPTLSSSSEMSDSDAIKLFGDMDRDTLMSGVFKDVLSDLMHSKKLTKENASKILFEYMDKGLLSKGDVAKISSELKII